MWDPNTRRLHGYYPPADPQVAAEQADDARDGAAAVWELDPALQPVSAHAFVNQRPKLVTDLERLRPGSSVRPAIKPHAPVSAPLLALLSEAGGLRRPGLACATTTKGEAGEKAMTRGSRNDYNGLLLARVACALLAPVIVRGSP